jgi:tetratricopeptide (TPR) repeat protein
MAKISKLLTSLKNHNLSAVRQFTDRESYKEAYLKALERIKLENNYVLNFYGFGGIGKTRLMKELQRISSEQVGVKTFELDFKLKANSDKLQALINLRESFRKGAGISFPIFDLAYTYYLKKASPQTAIQQCDLPFVETGDLLYDIISEFKEVPFIGSLNSAIKLGGKLYSAIEKKLNKAIRDTISELDCFEALKIDELLPHYFAQDVMAYVNAHQEEQLVIFLDTYEALWDNNYGIGSKDDPEIWIKDILIPSMQNVLFVILGRDKLRWLKTDKDWDTLLEQHFINELSEQDACSFLVSCGIEDEVLRTRMIKISKGHPLALDLCLDNYDAIKASREPVLSDFDLSLDINTLISRIVGHLNQNEKELVLLLSVVKLWNQEIVEAILIGFNIPMSKLTAGFLDELSIIQYDDNLNMFKMHDIASAYLSDQLNSRQKEQLHHIILEHYKTILDQMEISNFSYISILNEVLHHASELKSVSNKVVPWYILQSDKIQSIGRGYLILTNLKKIFEQDQSQSVLTGILLGSIYYSSGNYSNALNVFKSLEVLDTHDLTCRLYTLIGRTHHRMYNFQDAKEYYHLVETASKSFSAEWDYESYRFIIDNGIRYAKLLLQLSEFEAAENMQLLTYDRIKEFQKTKGDSSFRVELARLLEKMCEYHGSKGDSDLGEQYGKEALTLYADLSKELNEFIIPVRLLQDYGLLLKRLAEATIKRGGYDEAISFYEQAIDKYESAIEMDAFDIESYRRKGFAARGLLRTLYKTEGFTVYAEKVKNVALEAFNEAIKLNNQDASLYNAIAGLIKLKAIHLTDPTQCLQEALTYYEKAYTINPNYPYVYHGIAMVYYELSQLSENPNEMSLFIDLAKRFIDELYVIYEKPTFIYSIEEKVYGAVR